MAIKSKSSAKNSTNSSPWVGSPQARAVELRGKGLTYEEIRLILGYAHRSTARMAYLVGVADLALAAQREAAAVA